MEMNKEATCCNITLHPVLQRLNQERCERERKVACTVK